MLLTPNLAWALRGWSSDRDGPSREQRFYHRTDKSESYALNRADTKAIPEWKEIEHRQDGKHRLGHNPVLEAKDIFQEDFEAVRASRKRRRTTRAEFRRKGGDRAALSKL